MNGRGILLMLVNVVQSPLMLAGGVLRELRERNALLFIVVYLGRYIAFDAFDYVGYFIFVRGHVRL
jgi:hypothetical protein